MNSPAVAVPPDPACGPSPSDLFLDRIRAWERQDPNRPCLHRIDARADGTLAMHPFTVGQVLDAARVRARLLREYGVRPADRVLLCFPNTEAFLEWFLGVWWLGAIPVPLPSLSAFGLKSNLLERVRGVITDCAPRALVVDAGTARCLAPLAIVAGEKCELIDAESAEVARRLGRLAAAGDLPARPAAPHEVGFIQYTSGSTETPRGVVVTQDNLRANIQASGEVMRCSPEDRFVSWLPLYHDMGLIGGLLVPLYFGIPAHLISPVAFMARPAIWLRAIAEVGATLSVAPNFAYSFCLRKVRDEELAGVDLRRWRLAVNGAEPIDARTALGFVERFGRFGLPPTTLFPAYGLAEATLTVTFPRCGEPIHVDYVHREGLGRGMAPAASGPGPGVAALVSVGRPIPGHTIEIRDPDRGERCPERRLGEILVRGPSVTPGYFSPLWTDQPPRETLHTGDVGYLADGCLYVVDRMKDLIIVAGRNFAPSDVERSATVEGVRPGRVVAFGVPDRQRGTEAMVVAVESREKSTAKLEAIGERIKAILLSDFGLAPKEVVLLEPSVLPSTSSGKVMRRRTRELYLKEELVAGGRRRRGRFLDWLVRWTT